VLRPPYHLGSFVDTTIGFEDFQARLSSSFRRSMRSARKKAVKEHGLEFERITGIEAARPELFAEFVRVEASGWKGANGSAIACHPDRVAFYTALTQRLARRGWLEWNLERLDGAVVAAHLGVRFGPSVLLPKGGYDEAHARFQPGNLLFWEVFARCFADETVHEVNFLSEKPWMGLWKMEHATYQDLVVVPRRPAATLSGLLEVAEPRRRASEYVHARPELLHRVEETRRRVEQARRWAAARGRGRS
jgi:CelD/BcsL family acetyltransferase involved in cellulose biosynthesis